MHYFTQLWNKKIPIYTLLIFMLIPLISSATISAYAQSSYPIIYRGKQIGKVNYINLTGDKSTPGKLQLKLAAIFPKFAANIDRLLKQRGNFGSCSKRLFWIGNTRVRDANRTLKLTSRIRYEQWTCVRVLGKTIKTRIFRDTKSVDWRIYLKNKKLSKLIIGARVQNVQNFPNFVERLLGLRVDHGTTIPIPIKCGRCSCDSLSKSLDVRLVSARFTQKNRDTSVQLNFSFSGNLGTALSCF